MREFAEKARGHPCFDKLAHHRVGRMHIPVAPACNIKCRYCHREVGGLENRPGVAAGIISPAKALELVERVVAEDPAVQVIGVAGPGDALAVESTFTALKLIHDRFPELRKCVSTNGLMLAERVKDLLAVGVTSVSVTVNAVTPEIGRQFYRMAVVEGRVHREDAFDVLSVRQLKGIERAARAGLAVKVNTVLVPEINGEHIEELAREMRAAGARLMNIMPLKPIGEMRNYPAPTCFELEEARYEAEKHIEQFRLCKQCRADAIGIPGAPADGQGDRQGCNPTLGEIFTGVPLYH